MISGGIEVDNRMLKSIEMIKKLDKKLVNMLAELRQDYVVKYLCLKISSILI